MGLNWGMGKIQDWKWDKILPVILIIYPLLMIWQGLDFTDTGYSLVNYQQIFNDPESIQYGGLIFWLTNIIGGTWWLLVGQHLGLIGMRLGGVLVMYLTMFITYKTLSEYIKKEYILLGLFFALIYNGRIWGITYDTLTALFYVSAAYFLQKGILRNNIACLFIAAFILGLNIFVRIPNLLGFGLIVTLFFCAYLEKIPSSKVIKQSLFFTGGFLLAIASVVLVMYYVDHLDLWLVALQNLIGQGANPHASHGIAVLLHMYLSTYSFLGQVLLWMLIEITIVLSLYKRYHASVKLLRLAIYFLAIWFAVIPIIVFKGYLQLYVFAISGILYIILMLSISNIPKGSISKRNLSLISLLILLITPLGSDLSLQNSIFGMWLAIPVSIDYISNLTSFHLFYSLKQDNFKFSINELEISKMRKLMLITFLVFSMAAAYSFTYRDSFNRLSMHHDVNHPLLRGVITTESRANVVQDFVGEVALYVDKNDYLLAYGNIPMIHFLTQTRPYMYNSWPTQYEPETFSFLLGESYKEKGFLPVIVRARASTREFEWPSVLAPYDKGLDNYVIMNTFISSHNYKIIWQNIFFEILVPSNSKQIG